MRVVANDLKLVGSTDSLMSIGRVGVEGVCVGSWTWGLEGVGDLAQGLQGGAQLAGSFAAEV